MGNAHTLTPPERPGVPPLGIDIEVAGVEQESVRPLGIGMRVALLERPGARGMGIVR